VWRANLEILDKPLEESYEMVCFSDIPGHSFLKEVFGENCTIAQLNCRH
jgi:hypothetical protein